MTSHRGQSGPAVGGMCYHAINRGNGRAEVFHKEDDYAAFVKLVEQACARLPMRVLAYCLMPNHFHLVLWPHGDGDLGRWMQWLLTSHVRRYHRHYHGSGHVWQGRFKAFPIQEDEHLLTVLRYVERNPLRANLVARAQQWRWSSAGRRGQKELAAWLHVSPVRYEGNWLRWVNRPQTPDEEAPLRECIARGRPYGGSLWQRRTAQRLGLESSLRPRGRPRLTPKSRTLPFPPNWRANWQVLSHSGNMGKILLLGSNPSGVEMANVGEDYIQKPNSRGIP